MIKRIYNSLFNYKRESIQALKTIEKKNDELIWAHIFNNTIQDSTWLQNKSFSPGRWAAGYPLLYLLYRICNDTQPKQILEFGLGESTKLLYQYSISSLCQFNIIEHNQDWIDFFSKNKFDISNQIIKLELDLQIIDNAPVNIYKDLSTHLQNKKFDCIIIDGPFGSSRNSRPQIINLVEQDRLEEEFIIVMDDYNRIGEQDTIRVLKQKLDHRKILYTEGIYSGEKSSIVICSPKYSFLTAL